MREEVLTHDGVGDWFNQFVPVSPKCSSWSREEGLGAHPVEVVHVFVCLYKVGSQSPYSKGFQV